LSCFLISREAGCRTGGNAWGGVAAVSRKPEPSESAVSLNDEAGLSRSGAGAQLAFRMSGRAAGSWGHLGAEMDFGYHCQLGASPTTEL